jgi:benzoyl-CoA reductase/2-hydroxyglutaryl-CoA dehydratase subunit BcrC/BadD/HgdB
VPYRITGALQPITEADAYLETLMCPFVRSCFDLALKKRYDFVDGMIWPNSCDTVQRTFDIWSVDRQR